MEWAAYQKTSPRGRLSRCCLLLELGTPPQIHCQPASQSRCGAGELKSRLEHMCGILLPKGKPRK